jgi:hypothetical protein
VAGLMFGRPNGIYRLQVTKVCSFNLQSDPSEPIAFHWTGQIPQPPARLRFQTTISFSLGE